MSKEVKVAVLPMCDFCKENAQYDGKTKQGPWANMCQSHFNRYGVGLGTGKGQKLILSYNDMASYIEGHCDEEAL